MPRTVIFSTISHLDLYREAPTEKRWRPLLELLRVHEFPVDKLCFFISFRYENLVPDLLDELHALSPQTEIVPIITKLSGVITYDDIAPAYAVFSEYFANYTFDLSREAYYFHLGPGNLFPHTLMLIMLFHFMRLPFQLLRMAPQPDTGHIAPEIYEGDIRKWIATIAQSEHSNLASVELLKSAIKTRNIEFNNIIEEIEYVATHSTASILLTGPTGSGKSHLARKIYELRYNRGLVPGPLVEVNCATLRGEGVLSNLFGHVRGSFTGAGVARQGLLRSANEGVLFLDEITEIPLEMQSLLLKAIEEKVFYPFGSDIAVSSNFQLICGTNRDLMEEVREGRFRLDLLSRINIWQFALPPLTERPEDISPNIDYELRRHTRLKGFVADFLPEARERYLAFAMSSEALWPGNFRDLSASIERMQTYALSGVIDVALVEREIARLHELWHAMGIYPARTVGEEGRVKLTALRIAEGGTNTAEASPATESASQLERLLGAAGLARLDLFDRLQLEQVVRVCCAAPSRSEAGRRLFNASRTRKTRADDTTRLNKCLKSFGLTWEQVVTSVQQGPFGGDEFGLTSRFWNS